MQQDHHGIVAEVVKPDYSAAATGALVLVAGLAFWVALAALMPAKVALSWFLFTALPLTVVGKGLLPWVKQRVLRVVVRLSEEYLVIEESLPLSALVVTRVALSRVRSVKLRWASLVLEADGFGEVQITCQDPQVRKRLLVHVQQAIAAAPGPTLRRSERPPEAIEQLRAEQVRERA